MNRLESFVRNEVLSPSFPTGERTQQLEEIALQINTSLGLHDKTQLVFICTHNSRRSQLAQAWASVAAHWYGMDKVEAYSGGTETTAFHPNAIAALQASGLDITTEPGANPLSEISLGDTKHRFFSKHFRHPANPTADFIALMTCSEADQSCPIVPGAWQRMALSYTDPKGSDGTPQAADTYFQTSRLIAREIFYLFSKIPAQDHG